MPVSKFSAMVFPGGRSFLPFRSPANFANIQSHGYSQEVWGSRHPGVERVLIFFTQVNLGIGLETVESRLEYGPKKVQPPLRSDPMPTYAT